MAKTSKAGRMVVVSKNVLWFRKVNNTNDNNNDADTNKDNKETKDTNSSNNNNNNSNNTKSQSTVIPKAVLVHGWKSRNLLSFASGHDAAMFVDANGGVFVSGLWGYSGEAVPTQGVQRLNTEAFGSDTGVAVACSFDSHLCLTDSGACYQWGWPESSRKTPRKVSATTSFQSIACGFHFAAAIDIEGKLWIWGDSDELAVAKSQPNVVDLFQNNRLVSVACGKRHLLALTEGGQVFAISGSDTQATLVTLEGSTKAKAIACGDSHNLVCTEDGRVFAWGGFENSCLGFEASEFQSVPRVVPSVSGVVGVSAFASCSTALLNSGVVYVWGGQNATPTLLDLGKKSNPISAVSCGASHVLLFSGPLPAVPFAPALSTEDEVTCKHLLVSSATVEHSAEVLNKQCALLRQYQKRLNHVMGVASLRLWQHQTACNDFDSDTEDPLADTKEEYELVVLGLRIGLSSARPSSAKTKKPKGFIETRNMSQGLRDAGFSLGDDF